MPQEREYEQDATARAAGEAADGGQSPGGTVRTGAAPNASEARAAGEAAGSARLPGTAVPTGTALNSNEGGSAEASSAGADRAVPPETDADASRTVPADPPLITAVEIENFKGIGRPVRIDLRPITLLFGRNSAGKSTVLHALCYAHEILSHRNVDAHKTSLGGDQIDLGGFQRFVHGHDRERSVRLRFELNIGCLVLPEPGGAYEAAPLGASLGAFPEVASLEDAETGWLELKVRWKTELDGPIVSDYEVGVDGQILGHIQAPPSGRTATLLANLSHPLLRYDLDRDENDTLSRYVGQVREDSGAGGYGHGFRQMKVLLEPWNALRTRSSAVPSFDQHFLIHDETLDERLRFDMPRLLAGIGILLRDELAAFRYLGPLRDLHPRAAVDRDRSVAGRWADGSAAWDVLNRRAQVNSSRIARDYVNPRERNRAMVVPRVSDWLSNADRLDTGYRLHVRNVVELPANTPLVDELNKGVPGEHWAAIKAKEVKLSGEESPGDIVRKAPPDQIDSLAGGIAHAPVRRELQLIATSGADLHVRTSEIGVGISQILPVVVAALDPDRPEITAIEQPELHVHPRLQVELGDLFAEQAAGGRVFLIETHSEHLMLRLLRRIEETGSGELPEGKPALKPDQVSVVYVDQIDGEVRATRLRIDETGEFIDHWPQGFFRERVAELF